MLTMTMATAKGMRFLTAFGMTKRVLNKEEAAAATPPLPPPCLRKSSSVISSEARNLMSRADTPITNRRERKTVMHEARHCEGNIIASEAKQPKQSSNNQHSGLLPATLRSRLKTVRNDGKWRFLQNLGIAMCAIAFFCLFTTPSLKAQTEELNLDIVSDTASDSTVIVSDTLLLPQQDAIALPDTLMIHEQDTVALNDTLQQAISDTIAISTKTTPVIPPDNAANPHRATLWSLIPGGGQIYNWNHGDKAWLASLKLAAVYGGFGTLTYFIVQNTNDYRAFRDAYKWVSSEHESGRENKYTDGSYSADQLNAYMNYYQTNMEWCYFFTGLLYGLQIVEATVTAHLLTFDVSDNLSLSVKPLCLPDFSTTSLNNVFGLSLCYKIQYK